MKPFVRKTILIAVCAALVALLGVVLSASRGRRQLTTCEGLKVEFADAHRFVTEEDVKGWLEKHYGSYIGQRIDSVGLDRIEGILNDQSAILGSEAWTTEDGLLHVRITQRVPVLRLQKGDVGCYVDDRGFLFPLQKNYTAPVPVVQGAIPVAIREGYKGRPQNALEQRWVGDALAMMDWIRWSRVWKEAFTEISVSPEGDLILTPRQGRERFIFGQPDGVAGKFDKIAKYYEYIRPAREDGYYKTVNVKFDHQIICRQK